MKNRDHVRGKNMPAIAIVEQGVALDGAYAEHEYIPLDCNQPLDAFCGCRTPSRSGNVRPVSGSKCELCQRNSANTQDT